jgi:hypothetical protein
MAKEKIEELTHNPLSHNLANLACGRSGIVPLVGVL